MMSSTLKQSHNCIVQALRLCTGRMAHRGSRGIALPFHDRGTRRGWGVSVTPRLLFTPGKDPVPIHNCIVCSYTRLISQPLTSSRLLIMKLKSQAFPRSWNLWSHTYADGWASLIRSKCLVTKFTISTATSRTWSIFDSLSWRFLITCHRSIL
jgi:hypothetical protein